jgi:hypothetical protein
MNDSNVHGKRSDCNPRGTKPLVSNLPPWAEELLDELAEGEPVKIKRWQARDFRRALFGPEGLRDVPRGKGTRTFRLPNGDTLRFEYEPKWSPEELAHRAQIAQRGGTWYAEDEARDARYVTVTLLPRADADTPGAEVTA